MKREAKSIAAIFAMLLALCGMGFAARAQTVEGPSFINTFYYESPDRVFNIVLRLRRQSTGTEVSGAFNVFRSDRVSVFALKGLFYPDSGTLTVRAEEIGADGRSGTFDGRYDQATNTIRADLVIEQPDGTKSSIPGYTLTQYTGNTAYIVGIWQWSSATSEALLNSAPTYNGRFYILRQSLTDGIFSGAFGGTNAQDVGTIVGQVTSDGVIFKRTGTFNGLAFDQVWSGPVLNNGQVIRGNVGQNTPSPWYGLFTAHW
jgi:hypothetical protein